jgi:predicted dinucleotide-utilizing enzyme
MDKTRVALLGAGFIAEIHMESYKRFVPEAEVVAVYTRNAEKAKNSPPSTESQPRMTTSIPFSRRRPAMSWTSAFRIFSTTTLS